MNSSRARLARTLSAVAAVVAATGVAAVTGVAAAVPAAARTAPAPCSTMGSDIFVSDSQAFGANDGGLIKVDSLTGTRSTLSENNNPAGGPAFETPNAMTLDASGAILVAEGNGGGVPALIRVDRGTGVRTLVSSNTAPAGNPNFHMPVSVAVEANGTILVLDNNIPNGKVIRVDPVTGVRTTLSRNQAPAGGPSLSDPWDIAVASNGDIYVLNNLGAGGGEVIRVDPVTGARTLVSGNTSPAGGPSFVLPMGMTLDPNGDILVSDRDAFGGDGGIIRVDPVTGVRTTVSENAAPAGGPSFDNPQDLVYHCGAILIVERTGTGSAAVLRVDPATGARTTVSDNASPGTPNFSTWPWGIAARARPGLPTTPGPGQPLP